MKDKKEKYEKRRVRSSYISVIVSTTLVLFVTGLIGILVLSADKLSDYIKENFAVSISIEDKVKEQDLEQFVTSLSLARYTKTVTYISREDALATLKADLGEDFVDFIGENPLSNKIDLFLKSDFATTQKIDSIKNTLTENEFVARVDYDRLMLDEINANIRTISLALAAFVVLFLVISVVLINNSIRLTIYSKRFTIKTMQLVGATHRFISTPFVLRSMLNGLISSIIAIAMISALVYYLYQWYPDLQILIDFRLMAILFIGIVICSVLITALSAELAMRKFLRVKVENLYY